MRTLAVLPVKSFGGAKQRLAVALSTGSRRALAEAMFIDVLTALRRSTQVEDTLVVSAEHAAMEIGRGHGALILNDPDERGQSSAARLGGGHATTLGYERVLLVPGDTPALDPAELDALLARATAERLGVAIVADRHGTGTNGLLLTPPDAIDPAFGPGSFRRHVAAAEAAPLRHAVVDVPTLALDVDTPEDLDALRDALAAHRGGAAHTRGMLMQLERATIG